GAVAANHGRALRALKSLRSLSKPSNESRRRRAIRLLPKRALAMLRLKRQLQHNYEQMHPELRERIHLVLDAQERNAWTLSRFPHLLLPGSVEACLIRSGQSTASRR